MTKGRTGTVILLVCLVGICCYLFYVTQSCTTANDVYIQHAGGLSYDTAPEGVFSGKKTSAVRQKDFTPRVIPASRNASFDYKAAMQKLNEAKEGGFYVECGALNGERGSNTLFFEKARKWNGLLVEADPSNFEMLKSKNRKAFIINACLNTQPYPSVMTFNKAFNRGRIVNDQEAKNWVKQHNIPKNEVRVQCFPLYSLLLALNQLTVDFFSLDVEGEELNVLKTVPWGKVNIRMMTVEYVHGQGGVRDLKTYVESKDYESLLMVTRWDGGVNDIIFRKKGLTH